MNKEREQLWREHDAELAHRMGKAERRAGQDAMAGDRDNHPPEDLSSACPQRHRRLDEARVNIAEGALDRLRRERQAVGDRFRHQAGK